MNNDRINEVYFGKLYDLNSEFYKRTRNRINWICSQAHGDKVLDLGCSQGVVCLLLGCEGFNCIGVDNEESAINYARHELENEEKAVQQRVSFILAEATKLPFEDNSFDTIILTEVLEHLNNPDKILAESKRVLKEKGKIIITVPFGLLLFDDHKKTYYPATFLDIIYPYFNTSFVDIVDKNIFYTGILDSINKESKDSFVNRKIKLIEKVEKKFLEVEYELDSKKHIILDLKEKINESNKQYRTLKSKIGDIEKLHEEELQTRETNFSQRIKEIEGEHKEELQTRETNFSQRIKEIEKENTEKLLNQNKEYIRKLVELERQNQSKLYDQENLLKTSLTWRIGRVPVKSLIFLRNFILNPIRFIVKSSYRKNGISGFINSPTQQLINQHEVQKIVKKLSSSLKEQTSSLDSFNDNKLTFGAIMDVFTTACFKPECNLLTFRPDNWKDQLEKIKPDAIFVESAWNGNDGAWQYRIANYQKNMGDELIELIDWARQKGLPTIFWNKEDPPNYDRFIDKAKLFDYIFTSDSDCIPKYNKVTGNKKVYPLPFAAQPQIHNPILTNQRKHEVCFAGTYYGGDYIERQKDMEVILKPALDFNLHIYDRQYGMVGNGTEQFRFPDIYQTAIQGRLEYNDMIKAYKNYKVFLNVNSVNNSPTMFSRRVFELMACGTPVISTYSKGIEELLDTDYVFFTESEEDTRNHLNNLLGDEEFWSRASLRGIRKVLTEHTYEKRLQEISDKVGLDFSIPKKSHLSVLSIVENEKGIWNLQNSLKQQKYKDYNLILIVKNNLNDEVIKLRKALSHINIHILEYTSSVVFNKLFDDIKVGEYICFMNCNKFYGPNYLFDYYLSTCYASPDFIGKSAFFQYLKDDSAKLHNGGAEFQYVNDVPMSTLAIKKVKFTEEIFNELLENERFKTFGNKILSLDRYNFIDINEFGVSKRMVEKVGI